MIALSWLVVSNKHLLTDLFLTVQMKDSIKQLVFGHVLLSNQPSIYELYSIRLVLHAAIRQVLTVLRPFLADLLLFFGSFFLQSVAREIWGCCSFICDTCVLDFGWTKVAFFKKNFIEIIFPYQWSQMIIPCAFVSNSKYQTFVFIQFYFPQRRGSEGLF